MDSGARGPQIAERLGGEEAMHSEVCSEDTSARTSEPEPPVRDGTQESLHAFLQRELAVVYPEHVQRERRRRLTGSDHRFRAMHLVRHRPLRFGAAMSVLAVALIGLATECHAAVWYLTEPVEMPWWEKCWGKNQQVPSHEVWISPSYVISRGWKRHLRAWRDEMCTAGDYTMLASVAKAWAEQSKGFRALIAKAGCKDKDTIRCMQVARNRECFQGENSWICPLTCGPCPYDPDPMAWDERKVSEAWCQYRSSMVEHLEKHKEYMQVIACCIVVLQLLVLCNRFSWCIIFLCAAFQIALIGGCATLLLMLSSGRPVPQNAHADFVAALHARVQEPVHEALHKVTLKALDTQKAAFGIHVLWVSWCCLVISTVCTLVWLGQLGCRRLTESLIRMVRTLIAGIAYGIFILPMWLYWKFFVLIRCGMCDSRWKPTDEYILTPKFTQLAAGAVKGFSWFASGPLGMLAKACSDFKAVKDHFMRTFEWDGLLYETQVASEKEKIHMEQLGIRNISAQNYLVQRRSHIVVSLVFGTLYGFYQLGAISTAITACRAGDPYADAPENFEDFVIYQQRQHGKQEAASDTRAQGAPKTRRLFYDEEKTLENMMDSISNEMLLDDEQGASPEDTGECDDLTDVSIAVDGGVRPKRNAEEENEAQADRQRFIEYLVVMLQKGVGMMMIGMKEITILDTAMRNVAECSAFFCLILASATWCHLKTSRAWVLTGWAFLIFSPFLGSMIPASLFIEVDEVHSLFQNAGKEFIHFQKADGWVRDCQHMVDGNFDQMQEHRKQLSLVCQRLDQHQFSLKMFGMSGLRDLCKSAMVIDGSVNYQKMEEGVQSICSGLQILLLSKNSNSSNVDEDFQCEKSTGSRCKGWFKKKCGGENQECISGECLCRPDYCWQNEACRKDPRLDADSEGEQEMQRKRALALNVIRGVATSIEQTVRFVVATQFSVSRVWALLPGILSVVPALLLASWKFRVLLPLAKMPGLLLLALPLLYFPLFWGQYCFFWQLVPDWMLGIFLICQCFGDIRWPFMTAQLGFFQPMSRPLLNRALKKMGAASMLVMFVMYGFLVLYFIRLLYFQKGRLTNKVQEIIWNTVFMLRDQGASFWVQLAVNFVFKSWLSKVAAYDFIMESEAAEYDMNRCFEGMELKLASEEFRRSLDPQKMAYIQQVQALHHEGKETLDAFAELEWSSKVQTSPAGHTLPRAQPSASLVPAHPPSVRYRTME